MNKTTAKNLPIFLAFALPLAAWFLQLFASFYFSTFLCSEKTGYFFHLITLFCLIISAIGIFFGQKISKKREGKLLFIISMSFAVLMTLIIIVAGFGNFLLRVCQ